MDSPQGKPNPNLNFRFEVERELTLGFTERSPDEGVLNVGLGVIPGRHGLAAAKRQEANEAGKSERGGQCGERLVTVD